MTPQELIARYNIRHLYHFTDTANVESIRANGGLLSLEQLELRGIIAPRPGGNQWSHDADRWRGLHRYVHLSFTDDHPMRYVAENDGRIGPTCALRISASILHGPGLLFTTDIANKSSVQLLDWDQAVSVIDFEVLYTRLDWRDPEIQNRKQRARRAEILVPNSVSVQLIENI